MEPKDQSKEDTAMKASWESMYRDEDNDVRSSGTSSHFRDTKTKRNIETLF